MKTFSNIGKKEKYSQVSAVSAYEVSKAKNKSLENTIDWDLHTSKSKISW